MSARVYSREDWHAARRRRAQAGKAPRLSLQRSILLHQSPDGRWAAAIIERRFGFWCKPQWLCSRASLAQARSAALLAWRQLCLPFFWSYAGELPRGFRAGVSEPEVVRA